MTITVKFFASLRERVGQAEASVSSAEPISVDQVWAQATSNMAMPDNTLCAINMQYVDGNQQANDGDEVAFFPPVTGG
ncbi:MAG: MoaD/ThiS family protein [Gammaproteobacteria bacterium]|nr:MoaD/ThiS family protein [Gammaproteobacteria bacterium]